MIVGTGTNACYVEKVSRIPKWQPAGVSPGTETVINIEWGAFYSPHLPMCALRKGAEALHSTARHWSTAQKNTKAQHIEHRSAR